MDKKAKSPSRSVEATVVRQQPTYPDYISIYDGETRVIVWSKEEALRLAYRLMSLASEL